MLLQEFVEFSRQEVARDAVPDRFCSVPSTPAEVEILVEEASDARIAVAAIVLEQRAARGAVSYVGGDAPLVLLVLPVKEMSNVPYYIRRLLRLADHYVTVDRAYLDSGFYQGNVASVLEQFGVTFVMQARRGAEDVDQLMRQVAEGGADSPQMRYGVADYPDDAHWMVALPKQKAERLQQSEPDDPTDMVNLLYTNAPMTRETAESIAEDYRSRWGIETGFRVIKEDFLPKSRSTTATMRTWYFNFAAHLYNLWVTANVVRAHDTGKELAGDHPFTAGRLMQAIEDDPYEANIRAEPSETLDFFDGLFL